MEKNIKKNVCMYAAEALEERLAQHCKSVILQLKIESKGKKGTNLTL